VVALSLSLSFEVVVNLELLAELSNFDPRGPAGAQQPLGRLMQVQWRRLILDECHDAVLLGGCVTERLLALQATNVWCVTGTPFPRGDESVWGINQMLRIHIKFVISNNPFTMGKRATEGLPPSHPFEQIKRLVYLRNTPASVGGELVGSRLVETAPYKICVETLAFSPIEFGFYQEQLNQVGRSANPFAPRYNLLRQLCCHPAASSEWHDRLSKDGKEKEVLSLEGLRERMVHWKRQDIAKERREMRSVHNYMQANLNSLAIAREIHGPHCGVKSTTPEGDLPFLDAPPEVRRAFRLRDVEGHWRVFKTTRETKKALTTLRNVEGSLSGLEVAINGYNRQRGPQRIEEAKATMIRMEKEVGFFGQLCDELNQPAGEGSATRAARNCTLCFEDANQLVGDQI